MSRALILILLFVSLFVGLWIDWHARWGKAVSARLRLDGRESDSAVLAASSRNAGAAASHIDGSVRVFGRISRRDGGGVWSSESKLVALDERANEISTDLNEDASFEFPRLHPGRWWIAVSAWECCTQRVVVDLHGDTHERQLDFVLDTKFRLPVRIVDAEGAPIDLRSAKSAELEVTATRFPMSGFVPDSGFAHARELVVSRALKRVELFSPTDSDRVQVRVATAAAPKSSHLTTTGFTRDVPAKYWGLLELDCPPPVYVSLLTGAVVEATQRVERDASEVLFTLTDANFRGSTAGAHIVLVDAMTSDPIADASVELTTATGTIKRTSDDRGEVHFERVEAGWSRLTISSDMRETSIARVCIRPREANDLGIVKLRERAPISGRVIDERGEIVDAAVECASLDRALEAARLAEPIRSRPSSNGTFTFDGTGRGRHVLFVRDRRWGARPVVVDASNGALDDVVIPAETPGKIAILMPSSISADAFVRIFDGARVPVLDEPASGRERIDMTLAPGTWTLSLHDGARVVLERTFRLSRDGLTIDLSS